VRHHRPRDGGYDTERGRAAEGRAARVPLRPFPATADDLPSGDRVSDPHGCAARPAVAVSRTRPSRRHPPGPTSPRPGALPAGRPPLFETRHGTPADHSHRPPRPHTCASPPPPDRPLPAGPFPAGPSPAPDGPGRRCRPPARGRPATGPRPTRRGSLGRGPRCHSRRRPAAPPRQREVARGPCRRPPSGRRPGRHFRRASLTGGRLARRPGAVAVQPVASFRRARYAATWRRLPQVRLSQ